MKVQVAFSTYMIARRVVYFAGESVRIQENRPEVLSRARPARFAMEKDERSVQDPRFRNDAPTDPSRASDPEI